MVDSVIFGSTPHASTDEVAVLKKVWIRPRPIGGVNNELHKQNPRRVKTPLSLTPLYSLFSRLCLSKFASHRALWLVAFSIFKVSLLTLSLIIFDFQLLFISIQAFMDLLVVLSDLVASLEFSIPSCVFIYCF